MYPNFNGGNVGFNPYAFQFPQRDESQTRSNIINVCSVQRLEDVQQVQMAYGEKKLIFVDNTNIIAFKFCDNMGAISTEYRETKVFEPKKQQLDEQAAAFAQLQGEIDSLKKQLGALTNNGQSKKSTAKSTEQSSDK